MAGFVGIAGKELSGEMLALRRALALTKYSEKVKIGECVQPSSQLLLGRSYFNINDAQDFFCQKDVASAWVDGEIFGDDKDKSFVEGLVDAYLGNTLDSFLRKADGVFIAILYDATRQKLFIISDRYGLKPFYIYEGAKTLILAPELKCFPSFASFDLKIRRDVVDCFIDLGHLLGTTTWFEKVNLLKPASVYEYDFEGYQLKQRYYWTWGDSKQKQNYTFSQGAEMLSHLFEKAVRSRAATSERLGISLSGGQDSRAILAAIYHDTKIDTFTFGEKNSNDVRIAARVAKKANVSNKHYPIHGRDWLSARFDGVWKTDGQMNMMHMHYSTVMDEIENFIDVNLSGFLGDVVLGGSYLLKKKKQFVDLAINETIAQHYYGKHHELSTVSDPFYNIDTVDAYLINNRGRRLIGMGVEEPNKTIPQRLPFFEIDLMEAAYSLPDSYRAGSKVYDQALLIMDHGRLFTDIPDASSGVPLSKQHSAYFAMREFVKKYSDKVKTVLGIPTSFVNYNGWIREREPAQLIRSILESEDALYKNFSDRDFVREFVNPHLDKKSSNPDKVLAALTLEVWLQQVLNHKHLLPEHEDVFIK